MYLPKQNQFARGVYISAESEGILYKGNLFTVCGF